MTDETPTGDDICGDGGVLKTIEKAGDAARGTPPSGSKVKVHYVGTLMDGSKFDSSRDRPGHFEFTIGQGQVIKGWDQGVATMHIGEVATLVCSSEYAYGERGSPPKIPGGATLKFEVELFGWKEARKEKWSMSDDERIDEAAKLKAKGTEEFKAGRIADALELYHDAAGLIDDVGVEAEGGFKETTPERVEEAKALLLSCWLNESQMCIKQQEWSSAVAVCTRVLGRDADNVKALFRRGLSYSRSGEFAAAKTDLVAASKLDPKNKEVRDEFAKAKEAESAAKAKDKAMAAKMFG
tara:strand:- start:464 stop:1351 length:888 start_codon:yes stop_codon:yes gene_type:complete